MTRRICSVCNGTGKIKNPQHNLPARGRLLGDPVVDVSIPPRVTCQNCRGSGWVGKPE